MSDDADRYAEGNREEADCRKCGQPIWIVYHGPHANHTIEARASAPSPDEEWRSGYMGGGRTVGGRACTGD